MSGWKIFLIVVGALVVIGLLVGGGIGLYRLGYARGLATAVGLAGPGQLPREFGWGVPGFGGGRLPFREQGGMMFHGGRMPFGMFGFGGGIVGLLLLAGVVTLIVLGIRALTRKHPAEVQAVAAPAAPASVETPPAKPARGARRTRAS
jgi:hypothetical protein